MTMTVKTTVRNGRIEFKAPDELPDGTEVLVDLTPAPNEKIGIDESEWRDDPAAIADWESWIQSIEPLEFTPDEVAEQRRFQDEMRRFNIEAVRRQMEDGLP